MHSCRSAPKPDLSCVYCLSTVLTASCGIRCSCALDVPFPVALGAHGSGGGWSLGRLAAPASRKYSAWPMPGPPGLLGTVAAAAAASGSVVRANAARLQYQGWAGSPLIRNGTVTMLD